MGATYNNPDAKSDVPLTDGELELARFIEEAAMQRIKELLHRMGVRTLTRYDTMETIGKKIAPLGITIEHIITGDDEYDGWWFYRLGVPEIHLKHPGPPDMFRRVNFQARYLS